MWGVLGGLGPRASVEFVRTIYDSAAARREQDAPVVYLFSDPSFPDRTEAFRLGTQAALVQRLGEAMRRLLAMGAVRVVICCVTIHHVVSDLPADLQAPIVHVPDVLLAAAAARRGRHLLLCTSGSREMGIFERRPGWRDVADRIQLPDAGDQEQVHRLIYRIKQGGCDDSAVSTLLDLLRKYRATTWLAGCTELHILANHVRRRGMPDMVIDPLQILAARIASTPIVSSAAAESAAQPLAEAAS